MNKILGIFKNSNTLVYNFGQLCSFFNRRSGNIIYLFILCKLSEKDLKLFKNQLYFLSLSDNFNKITIYTSNNDLINSFSLDISYNKLYKQKLFYYNLKKSIEFNILNEDFTIKNIEDYDFIFSTLKDSLGLYVVNKDLEDLSNLIINR